MPSKRKKRQTNKCNKCNNYLLADLEEGLTLPEGVKTSPQRKHPAEEKEAHVGQERRTGRWSVSCHVLASLPLSTSQMLVSFRVL